MAAPAMHRPGCCGCSSGCSGAICATVKGCNNLRLPGATVTVTLGGVTIGSGVTDGSGSVCIVIMAAATYTITITHPAFNTASFPLACTCTTTATGATLARRSGRFCCDGTVTYPTTLALSDNGTAVTLTSAGGCSWDGSRPIVAPPGNCVPSNSGDQIGYGLTYIGGVWTLQVSWNACYDPATATYSWADTASITSGSADSGAPDFPVNLTFNWPGDFAFVTTNATLPTLGPTITVTE